MGLKLSRDRPYGESILWMMDCLLGPEGEGLASFGLAWYHPLGGSLFSGKWPAV